jgi:hypothetical protein
MTISGHPFCDKLISLNNPTMPCRYLRASNSKLQQAILWIFIVLVTRNEVRVRTCDFPKWNQLGLSDEYLIVCPFKSFNLPCELRKKHPFTSYFKVQHGSFFYPSPGHMDRTLPRLHQKKLTRVNEQVDDLDVENPP